MTESQVNPTDKKLPRNRSIRVTILVVYVVLVVLASFILSIYLSNTLFTDDLARRLATITMSGLSITMVLAFTIEKYFLIRNNTTRMFITIDQLASLMSSDKVLVYYGPGLHISLPWEVRYKNNNISLEESANNFEVKVQLKTGFLTFKGSYRLRPDPARAWQFQIGVAAVADDVKDLIVSQIIVFAKGKNVITILSSLEKLNDFLDEKLSEGESDLERRFGVHIGDATVSEILPSKELQRTMSGIAESDAVFLATGRLFGYDSKTKIKGALESGIIPREEWERARRTALSISGNLEGMEIKRNEIDLDIKGLDPEVTRELSDVIKSPGVQAYLAGRANQPKSKGSAGSKKQSSQTENGGNE